MCPACLAALAWVATGVTGASGVTAFVVRQRRFAPPTATSTVEPVGESIPLPVARDEATS